MTSSWRNLITGQGPFPELNKCVRRLVDELGETGAYLEIGRLYELGWRQSRQSVCDGTVTSYLMSFTKMIHPSNVPRSL